MDDDQSSSPDPAQLRRWLRKLETRDPALHAELVARLESREAPPLAAAAEGFLPETAVAGEGLLASDMVMETLVREGRPALLIRNDRITTQDTEIDSVSKVIVDRLLAQAKVLEKVIPLVGRIDVKNHARGFPYVGTGWLIAEDVLVTNRHVALLIARHGASGFQFVAGKFGDLLAVGVDYRHEDGLAATAACAVERVLWIEMDEKKADIAFLKVARRTGGLVPNRIELATADAAPGLDVAVVGYPARAYADVIPDQAWMERVYGSRYDIKRIAPGLTDDPSRGWATHDCTTLGGNSGSVVLDMKTGKAVGLHFAGLYKVENYAVPASTIDSYWRKQPWISSAKPEAHDAPVTFLPATTPASGGTATVTFNLPFTVTVAIGQPMAGGATSMTATAQPDIEAAATALGRQLTGNGVLAVREGLVVEDGALVDAPCLVVAAHPERLDAVRAAAPAAFMGFRVQVRPASVDDQLGGEAIAEAPTGIAYDNFNRTGPKFRLEWFDEPMKLRCHVGPERSLEELDRFLNGTKRELVSSMYQFHTDAIRRLVDRELTSAAKPRMTLVLDPQSRDSDGPPKAGTFARKPVFDAWAATGRFERIFVPEHGGGLVDNAYHIKVTVKDESAVWLSSGNWTRTSQPEIPPGSRNDPKVTGGAGNREWHVVAEHKGLAERFRAHILQDFARSGELGGMPEAPPDDLIMVDVPASALEAFGLEGPPTKVFEPLVLDRKVRVRPILTPDLQGAVYCDAVLQMIRSAKKQILFQNQYINVSKASAGRFGELVDALAKASKTVPDVRITLRSDGSGFWDKIAELKRRGIDVATQVRRLGATHTKGIVVDGRWVIVGSQNWSASAVTVNRDASLLFDDSEIAAYYASVFEEDWARASILTNPPPATPSHEAPRLADGPAPPPGFVRMPLAEYRDG